MTVDPRLAELTNQILSSGSTPEEVCRDEGCEDLLPQIRDRLRALRAVEAQIDAWFPTSDMGLKEALHEGGSHLPTIPGYEVEAVLGRGGMGIVLRARQSRLNRTVALKMLLGGAYAAPHELERFFREAEAVASLQHPNVVQIHDMGEHRGQPYFTMELVEGGSLAQKLKGAPQPPRAAAELVATVANAVQAAHTKGIVHRDLKPSNILLAADGTPKVSDFGVARRLHNENDASAGALTFSGAPVGTPSYMSPEQAAGSARAGSIGPATDIYSLGAILYEMLTGRPPFCGDSAAETERQVITEEPVTPSRLSPRVPLDLQTICLKCLQKPPTQRYATALDLAEDLGRFLSGSPIEARPVSPVERAVRWVRRKPAPAALILTASMLIVLAAALGFGVWRSAAKRSAEVAAWTPLLGLVRQLERNGQLQEARALLERPLAVEAVELRSQALGAVVELDLARNLAGIRDGRQEIVNGRFDYSVNQARSDKAYETAFRQAGLGQVEEEPGAVAARIAQSPIRAALVAALDDWSVCAADEARSRWIMEVARRSDPDPSGWRDRVRQTGLSREALTDLATTAVVQDQSPQLLVGLGVRMQAAGEDATQFLDRVQRQYPGDLWACYFLGEAIVDTNPVEAVRYYQAALASHPESAIGHDAVGRALANTGRHDEAIPHFREALRREPAFAEAMSDLGWAQMRQGHDAEGLLLIKEAATRDDTAKAHGLLALALGTLDRGEEALAEYKRSIAIDPNYFSGHLNLSNLLENAGRLDDAMAELEYCRRLKPDSGWVHLAIAGILRKRGRIDDAIAELSIATRLDSKFFQASAHCELGDCLRAKRSPQIALAEYDQALLLRPENTFALRSRREVMVQLGLGPVALAEWEQALEAIPTSIGLWDGYAELCIYMQDQGAYEKACHGLLEHYGSSDHPQVCEHTGRACLLGIIPPADASRATALIERAVHADLSPDRAWARPYLLVAQGLARYRAKDFDGAVESIGEDSRKVLGPLPHLVLAMAYRGAGRRAEALRSFAQALPMFDWDPSHASGPDDWMCHVLRREAERTVIPNLDALLAGRDSPADQDERLALSVVCQSTKRYAMAAALYAELFDADPSLADHPENGRRYSAACCAAVAGRVGGGDGRDTASLSDEQRVRWSSQSRRWLQNELNSWSDGLAAGTKDPHLVASVLSQWRADPDLASLRDPELLASLATEEREECHSLWTAVDAVIARANAAP